jgi:hypothetical protein
MENQKTTHLGFGDVALAGDTPEVVVGDINAAMLGVGRDRLTDRGLVSGLRNVTDMNKALADVANEHHHHHDGTP